MSPSHATVRDVNQGGGIDPPEIAVPASTFTAIESGWLKTRGSGEQILGWKPYLEFADELRERGDVYPTVLREFVVNGGIKRPTSLRRILSRMAISGTVHPRKQATYQCWKL